MQHKDYEFVSILPEDHIEMTDPSYEVYQYDCQMDRLDHDSNKYTTKYKNIL